MTRGREAPRWEMKVRRFANPDNKGGNSLPRVCGLYPESNSKNGRFSVAAVTCPGLVWRRLLQKQWLRSGKRGDELAKGACAQRGGWNDSSGEHLRVSCRRETSEEALEEVIFRIKRIVRHIRKQRKGRGRRVDLRVNHSAQFQWEGNLKESIGWGN